MDYMLQYILNYLYISDASSLNFFGIIFMLIFIYLKKINYSIVNLKFFCTLILFGICIWSTLAISIVLSDLNKIETISIQYLQVILNPINHYQNFYNQESYALFFGFFYFKLILELKNIQRFGTFISTIEAILKKVLTFFILYAILLFTFAEMGTILFSPFTFTEEFKSLDRAIVTLINYTFGGFSIQDFYNNLYYTSSRQYIELVIFCYLFLFLFVIFLINLLIALISAIYSKTQDNGNELYLLELYKETKLLKYDKKFSSLTSSFPLIIQITFPLYAGYFFFRPEKVNFFILKFQYTFILIFNLILLLIFNILIIPISYLIGIFKFFGTMIITKNRYLYSILGYFFFLAFGIIFLIISSIVNIFYSLYIFVNPHIGKQEIDHIIFVPSKKSFRCMYKEILRNNFSHYMHHSLFKYLSFNDTSLTVNINSKQIIRSFRNSNEYSKIDLIFLSNAFNFCESEEEEEKIDYHHLLIKYKSQKEYFKSIYKCSKKVTQDKSNQWKNFIIFSQTKASSKIIIDFLNKS